MSPSKRYAKKHAKARARRRHNAQERFERDQRQAQRAAEALHQALQDLGLPENLGITSTFIGCERENCRTEKSDDYG